MEVKNVHEGHRKRKRENFLNMNIENMPDHEILELLLFYAYPRRDTNEIAHRLIEYFGNLNNVLSAPYEELVKVKDVGENAATFLILFSKLTKWNMDRIMSSRSREESVDVKEIICRKFAGEKNEIVLVAMFDKKGGFINVVEAERGSAGEVKIRPRKLVEMAFRCGADKIIIAHNHPEGFAVPSASDAKATRGIKKLLDPLEIELLDHLIVAENECYSMKESKKYPEIFGFFENNT